jgi:hypothetical protein
MVDGINYSIERNLQGGFRFFSPIVVRMSILNKLNCNFQKAGSNFIYMEVIIDQMIKSNLLAQSIKIWTHKKLMLYYLRPGLWNGGQELHYGIGNVRHNFRNMRQNFFLPTLNYSAQKLKQKSRLIFISSTYSFHNRLQKDEPVRWSITVLPNAQRKYLSLHFYGQVDHIEKYNVDCYLN